MNTNLTDWHIALLGPIQYLEKIAIMHCAQYLLIWKFSAIVNENKMDMVITYILCSFERIDIEAVPIISDKWIKIVSLRKLNKKIAAVLDVIPVSFYIEYLLDVFSLLCATHF